MTTVAFDAAVDNGGFTGQSSRSWSHTTGSGTNRVLYVVCCFWNNGGTVSSVTYGGTGLTRVLQTALTSNNDRVEIWRLLNPTSGAATVAVTFSASADGETASLSFSTVNQTTPERNTGSTTGSGTSASISATGAQTGDAILDGIADADRTLTLSMGAQSNRVQRFNDSPSTSGEGGAGSTVTTAPNPQTLNWSLSGTGQTWALGYVVIANDGGGATTAWHDTPFRFRLVSAATWHDTALRFRLVSAAVWHDTAFRFRLLANAFHDTPFRFKLQSPITWHNTPIRFRLQSPVTNHDTPFRFKLLGSGNHDTPFRFRLQLIGQNFHDTVFRYRLQSPVTWHNSPFRFSLQSAVVWHNTPFRFRLLASGNHDTPFRFRLQGALTTAWHHTALRFKLAAARDTAFRFRLVVPAGTMPAFGACTTEAADPLGGCTPAAPGSFSTASMSTPPAFGACST